jgi:hypothetical protein
MSEEAQRTGIDDAWEDLVVSILSVNQYSLERTYSMVDGLRRENITDPLRLARWESPEIEIRLRAAGCDRGVFMTKLFAERLGALGALIRTNGRGECDKVIKSRDAKAIENLLLPVHGIGPVVLRQFFLLRDLK